MTRSIEDIERDMNDPEAWGEPVKPRKSNKRQRDVVVSVRFTPSELSAVQGLAADRHVFVSTLLRDLALHTANVVQSIDANKTVTFGTRITNSSAQPPVQSPSQVLAGI